MANREIFYGAAIQGEKLRGQRALVHQTLIQSIKDQGFVIASSHTSARTREETAQLLEQSLGTLPIEEQERVIFVRGKMVEAVEGKIAAAVFEVSVPSLGTGVELTHAYLRPRMGLPQIPILLLYEADYWPNKLSTMIRGLSRDEFPNVRLSEYRDLDEAKTHLAGFLAAIPQPASR